ncbi:DUF2933 domain-containing protein [Saccharothrix variisporea]|uniref:DUF2933 family protein n=1 Tax=Saccharothrix variisporea TaxID=543527 RepID=A0A495XNN8_9PSEU|nr:DUF2933 domain-containing protein [Saccharothrix variisporea]RKT74524.1 DUF2933 family protein [Saccharothrix variisporea]
MKRRQMPLYAIALAILVVGLAFTGVPVQTILVGLLVLACPLMMLFMMGGHGGSDREVGRSDEHRPGPTSGQR